MSEKWDSRREERKDLPEWQRALSDEPNEEQANANEQESQRNRRFEPFPDDERREREQRRLNPDRDDLE